MTPEQVRALEARIAEALGMVPCDKWEPINSGRTGGPEMIKTARCHDKCYPYRTNYGDGYGCLKYLSDAKASRELRIVLRDIGAVHITLSTIGWMNANLDRASCGCRIMQCGEVLRSESGFTEEEAVARVFCAVKGIAWPEEA